MIELEVTLIRSSSEVDRKFYELWSNSGLPGSSTLYPAFVTIPAQNWVTGETIGFFLSDSLAFLPAGSVVDYALSDLSEPLPPDVELNTETGEVAGVVADKQGGTVNLIFTATGDFGTIQSSLTVALITLEIQEPTMAPLPDFNTQEEGGTFNLDLNTYITDDGDPAKVSAISFTYAFSNGQPAGVDFPSTGILTGVTTTVAALTVVTVTATNESGKFTPGTFDITVVSLDPASETPLFAGFYTGEPECAVTGTAPIWISDADEFFRAASDTSTNWSVDLNTLVNDGGQAITLWAANPDVFPTGISLDTATGIVSGSHDGTVVNPGLSNTFIATNSVGPSDSSPSFTWTVWDDTATIPEILSISGTEGTNTVYVNFTDPVHIDPLDIVVDEATSYEEGFAWTVNTFARNATYAGGGGTTQLEFSIDGAVLSANNTLGLEYTT